MIKKTWQEFKDFAVKGNVVDLAIAVVIGTAFSKIVSSFVVDIVMPLIGYLFGGVSFKTIVWVLKPAVVRATEVIEPAITINIGLFLQNIFDFLIIAFSIFFVIRLFTRFKDRFIHEKDGQKIEEPIVLSKDQELLGEIRDILKNNNNK
ncbi:MAG: large-conductance mechanosensitive channel protein MscL [Patescibacteria group bacterium]|jgi:large conductance mechanosensitive channel|nr:large-conductance mechanosensitive channel protein MscL [Patescibacteria group bacterium]